MPAGTVSTDPVPLRERHCRFHACQTVFYVCLHCDRGQRYCSATCRLSARKLRHRAAVAKYQRTDHGRRGHADCQHDYRHRQRALAAPVEIVTDPSSPIFDSASSCGSDGSQSVPCSPIPPAPGAHTTRSQHIPWRGLRCQFCGRCGYIEKRDFHEPDHPGKQP